MFSLKICKTTANICKTFAKYLLQHLRTAASEKCRNSDGRHYDNMYRVCSRVFNVDFEQTEAVARKCAVKKVFALIKITQHKNSKLKIFQKQQRKLTFF